MSDIMYMKMAFDLAIKGRGSVSPNPLVGAVIVKDEEVVGRGYHEKVGGHHAEINAIKDAKVSLIGSTLYCTLEPCCHSNKRTPPCVPEIIDRGIKRVVISNTDPNPSVSGNGIHLLKEAGIQVVVGVLEDYGKEINKAFFKHITTGLPYIHVKVAITLDGRMAAKNGDSKWITSDNARNEVHKLRELYDGVMVGSGTANADDPELTCRENGKVIKVPKRVVIGKKESLNKNLKLLNDEYKDSTIIVREEKIRDTLKVLLALGVTSLLVEGGPTLITSLFIDELVDEYSFYIAPKMIGNGPSVFNHDKFQTMSEALRLNGTWRDLGQGEVVFEGKLVCSQA